MWPAAPSRSGRTAPGWTRSMWPPRPRGAGGGWGRRLIARAARWARESGFQELVIFVVQGNRRAEQLYRGMGAKELYFFHDPVDGAPSWALAWEDLKALEELEVRN